ncbi:hypothetical protein KJ652_04810 [Patescibacteria group bacterium]|nr:hypothetical protein [Patescibacteria group bacterium]MBU1123886.1 hypothetical protein [Patescibacteria group bacterium]MBU1910992.1 hypothetical protein [Patescibacteria group bacterium]
MKQLPRARILPETALPEDEQRARAIKPVVEANVPPQLKALFKRSADNAYKNH